MGADLYIGSPELNSSDDSLYFRDPYNCSSIMRQLGYSWWNLDDAIGVITRADDTGYGVLDLPEIAEFLKVLKNTPLLPINEEWLAENHAEGTVDEWNQDFKESYNELINFLERALSMKTAIYTSL